MTTDPDDREPVHTASPTARILDQLQLHGYHPRPGEPDMRPLPEDEAIDGAIADIFDALTGTLTDTPLDADLEVLLWSTVNSFHRAAAQIRARSMPTTDLLISGLRVEGSDRGNSGARQLVVQKMGFATVDR